MTLSTTTTLLGYGATVKGVCDISEGDFREGTLEVIAGLGAISVGSCFESTNPHFHTALKLGAIAVVTKGATKLIQGVKERDFNNTLHGTLQTAVGCTAVVYLNCLDSKMIAVAHQSLMIGTASCYTSWQGIKDLINGDYKNGCVELLLGATGILSAGYYFYYEISEPPMPPQEIPPPELDSFLKNHESEVSEIYRTKKITGNWKKLGGGISKTAYTHPDMDFIIKIPHGKSVRGYSDSDVTIHYKYLKKAENLVKKNGYDRIVIPEAYLIQNSEGPLVVEKKFDFVHFNTKADVTIALDQFNSFMKQSGHCDINPLNGHNAAFLDNEEPSIGIIDFDCNLHSLRRDRELDNIIKGIIVSNLFYGTALAIKEFYNKVIIECKSQETFPTSELSEENEARLAKEMAAGLGCSFASTQSELLPTSVKLENLDLYHQQIKAKYHKDASSLIEAGKFCGYVYNTHLDYWEHYKSGKILFSDQLLRNYLDKSKNQEI